MIKIAHVHQLASLRSLSAEVMNTIHEAVTILDNEYGEETGTRGRWLCLVDLYYKSYDFEEVLTWARVARAKSSSGIERS